MAYGAKNINTLDLRKSTAIGVGLPFSAPSAFTSVYTTNDQLKYNIINYMLTERGERFFEPTFGLGLGSKVFEQMTDEFAATLEATIKNGVEDNFPSVEVVDINVTPYYDQNILSVSFTYRTVNTGLTNDITLNFENGQ